MDIQGKIAIVTGASSGLGAAISESLVRKGAKVYGLARNAGKLDQLNNGLGDNFIPIVIDITDVISIKQWVQGTFNSEHFPHILINNAGVSQFETVDKLSTSDWKVMVDTNLSAVHYLTSELVPFMKKDEGSSYIINVGSILGKTSGSSKSAYSATKFAIQGYTEALFKELRGFNIKVSVVNPGSINTQFFESSGISPNEKMLQPQEIADVVVFLLETPENVLIDELTLRPLRP